MEWVNLITNILYLIPILLFMLICWAAFKAE